VTKLLNLYRGVRRISLLKLLIHTEVCLINKIAVRHSFVNESVIQNQ